MKWFGPHLLLPTLLLCSAQAATAPPADEALAYLRHYLRINTSNPPGDVLQAAHFLQEILEHEGIETHLYTSLPGHKANLLARLPATGPPLGKPLLLLHHMDVVPADASRWPVDPFSAALKNGVLFGRGAMDMKAHGITQLMTLLRLQREHVPLGRDLLLLAVADEETGGELGAAWMIRHHWDELDPEYVLDEGGAGFQGLLSRERLVFGIAVAEKRVLWLRLSARGQAGHGSQPMPGSANRILLAALTRLLDASPPAGDDPVLAEMHRRLGTFPANKFTHAIEGNTLALTTLRAGVGDPPKVNVIPSLSQATLDCRLLPGESTPEFLAWVRSRLADARVRVDLLYESDASVTSPVNTPLYRAMETTLLRHYPKSVVTPMIIPYGTDSSAFRSRGTIGYGFLPMVVSNDVIGSMHGDAEHIRVDAFRRNVSLFYEMIRLFLERK